MFKQLDREEILYDWDFYQGYIHDALNASVGAKEMIGQNEKSIEKIFKKLTNPFNSTMQLWVQETDHEIDVVHNIPVKDLSYVNYLVLTQIQICEFTGRKSLLWFSCTRVREVDTGTMIQAYQEGEHELKLFAIAHDCEGISGYSDLDYYAKRVKEDWVGAITRHFFYLPLQEAA
tara:strand:- start:416 stop:940 length:525 start_codon:yes stop_codon:yes gene_type:complete